MAYLGNTPTTQNFVSGTDYFNGTGSQTAFTLSRTVNSINDIQAVVNNVVQQPNDAYTLSGTTITFTSAPSSGTNNVYVRYLSTTTQVITPSQNSVGTAQLAPLTTIPVVGGYTVTLPSATGTIALTSQITTPKVINVQTVTNSTRASLSSAGSTPVTLTTFTYNKQSASSSLIFIVMIPMDGSVSGTCASDLTYGSSSAFGSLYYSFTGETFIQVMQGQATLTGYTTTGSQTLTVRYYTADNSGGKPADIVNPNSSDDARMIQTVSTATVIEYS